MGGLHAILSPSAASRWLACTPSARFEEQIPEQESSYAAEGTLAHELAALMLSAKAGHLNDSKGASEEKFQALKKHPLFTREMHDHCEAYVLFVLSLEGEIRVEHEYDLGKYIPCGFGTADATVFTPRAIHVVDFKYGAGVRVTATANKQMMCYGLGAYEEAIARGLTPEIISLSIFQPRAGGSSSWSISAADLIKWAEDEVKPKATLAIAGMGDFTPGGHCQFCKAHTSCKAYYDRFADIKAIYDRRVIRDSDITEVLTYGSLVSSWIEKLQEECLAKMERGEAVPGFKLVTGRGRRSFKNEDDVVDILLGEGYDSEQIFDAKLCSLTAIEKLLGAKQFKSLFAEHITTVPGKPQIAPEDDERTPMRVNSADEYDA